MTTLSGSLQTTFEVDVETIRSTRSLTLEQNLALEYCQKSLTKKFIMNSKKADDAAIDLFLEINDRVIPDSVLRQFFDQQLREYFLEVMPPELFDTNVVFSQCDVGPGSSVASSGTSFFEKFQGRVTYSNPSVLRLFRAACRSSQTWSGLYDRLDATGGFVQVTGGKLTPVPKNSEISRIVITLPCLEVFTDKGVARSLERCLERLGVNLSERPNINRYLAKKGSINGKQSTLDSTSASDTIYHRIWVGDKILPIHVSWWIDLLRCDTVVVRGRPCPLHMCNTMGYGTTFPLQTLIFLAICTVAYKALGIPVRLSGRGCNLSVFGDDIVCHTRAYGLIFNLLKAYGMLPNELKSYNTGNFRESCGTDWVNGYNVRGVYIQKLNSKTDVYVAWNKIVDWCGRHDLPLPYHTLSMLVGLVPRKWRVFVPMHCAEDVGFRVFGIVGRYKYCASIASKYLIRPQPDLAYDYLLHLSIMRGECSSLYTPKGSIKDTIRVHNRPKKVRHRLRSGYTPNGDVLPGNYVEYTWLHEQQHRRYKLDYIAPIGPCFRVSIQRKNWYVKCDVKFGKSDVYGRDWRLANEMCDWMSTFHIIMEMTPR